MTDHDAAAQAVPVDSPANPPTGQDGGPWTPGEDMKQYRIATMGSTWMLWAAAHIGAGAAALLVS